MQINVRLIPLQQLVDASASFALVARWARLPAMASRFAGGHLHNRTFVARAKLASTVQNINKRTRASVAQLDGIRRPDTAHARSATQTGTKHLGKYITLPTLDRFGHVLEMFPRYALC